MVAFRKEILMNKKWGVGLLIVAVVLVSNYALLHEYGYEVLWFIPWFLAFAIIGAGASGICPVLVGLRWAGFK